MWPQAFRVEKETNLPGQRSAYTELCSRFHEEHEKYNLTGSKRGNPAFLDSTLGRLFAIELVDSVAI